ncbi:MAG: hypothetical protein KGL35_19350 [Bradyrhizobium sp.]|nr:hypothetical protein [Bradyrhizobium sp.]
MAFGFGSPQFANQLAALGAMQGAMPTGTPLQSMAPVIPMLQGGIGGMMGRMMPAIPGAPQRPQQQQGVPAQSGLMGINPQMIQQLLGSFGFGGH